MESTGILSNNSVPALCKDEKYHLFISYSNADTIWVYDLMHKLEESIPSLKVCYHERDFLPGKTVIDNMVESILSSQKTLVVLSPDFVRSHWCLFEANLSIFRECLGHKAIIPVMLKPCTVPLHLSYLTYLEAQDDNFFEKLSHVLLTSNGNMVHSTLVLYQPSVLYIGKTLLTLSAVNEGAEDWQPGIFSSAPVPDSLKAVLDGTGLYKKVIGIINDIEPSHSCLRYTVCKGLLYAAIVLLALTSVFLYLLFTQFLEPPIKSDLRFFVYASFLIVSVILMPILTIKISCWKRKKNKTIKDTMVLKTGKANIFLMKTSVLVGCSSKFQLLFVYVSLDQCKQMFDITFGHGTFLARDMWQKAIVQYSSDYACCLAKKYFPFHEQTLPGHWEDGICFCQYVAKRLKNEN